MGDHQHDAVIWLREVVAAGHEVHAGACVVLLICVGRQKVQTLNLCVCQRQGQGRGSGQGW
jgi:hypothetical protein